MEDEILPLKYKRKNALTTSRETRENVNKKLFLKISLILPLKKKIMKKNQAVIQMMAKLKEIELLSALISNLTVQIEDYKQSC